MRTALRVSGRWACPAACALQTSSSARRGRAKRGSVPQVRGGQHVSAHGLLQLLPAAALPELRVALLERLGRHLEALR